MNKMLNVTPGGGGKQFRGLETLIKGFSPFFDFRRFKNIVPKYKLRNPFACSASRSLAFTNPAHKSCAAPARKPRTWRLAAFTLAEALITMTILGVISAITIPAVINNVQSNVKEKRVANIRQKLSKGTDAMMAVSDLTGYDSTLSFVQEFQKHFGIMKICENSNIADCWPTETVILDDDGNEWDISKTTTASTLKMPANSAVNWDKTVGIVTLDGTSMILTYNTKCSILDDISWSEDSSSSNQCIAAIFDWNGGKKPNKYGEDVLSINALGLGTACTLEAGSTCFGTASKPSCLSDSSESYRTALGIEYASAYVTDYWGGAVEAVGGVSNMPTYSELQALNKELWSSGSYDSEKAASIGLPTSPGFYVWASTEISKFTALYVSFETSGSTLYDQQLRNNPNPYALPVAR